MDELFRPALGRTIAHQFPWARDAIPRLERLFQPGTPGDASHGPAWPHPWRNAEQFYEVLALAASPPGDPTAGAARHALNDAAILDHGSAIPDSDWERLEIDARRYLQCATSAFLLGFSADVNAERWLPYRRWARGLRGGDTVISFNYDRVAETAAAAASAYVYVPLPQDVSTVWTPPRGTPVLLKLHGSVDWAVDPTGTGTRFVPAPSDWGPKAAPPRIVGPGPAKARAVDSHFSGLWAAACKALECADRVVIVGYRLPESDAVAKARVMDALVANTSEGLVVTIVLGPERTPDVERLAGMARWALGREAGKAGGARRLPAGREREDRSGRSSVAVEPLFAEDYLQVARQE